MLALLSAAFAASPSPELTTAMTGRWRLADARAVVQTRVDAAVESALSPFNTVIRGMARPLMAKAATFCEAYTTQLTTTTFTLACDGASAVTATFGQAPVAGESGGRAFQLSGRFEDGGVILNFSGDAGVQRVRYTSGGPDSFLVNKNIHADRLDADVVWDMRYTRQ
jgi:hypothetical protein